MSKTIVQIDSQAIGVEVSWSFGYGNAEAVTLPRAKVRELLQECGFDTDLVADYSEDIALRKAQRAVKGRSKTLVIQELRRPNKDTPRAFGVYKVIGKEGERGDDVRMGARVRCGARQIVCLPPEGETVFTDTECEAVGNEIARIGNSLLDNVVNRDISDMLVAIGWARLGWISRRRNSGGVYFVPTSDDAERFIRLLQGLESMSHAHASPRRRPGQDERMYHFIPQVMEVYPKPLTMSMWSSSAKDQYAAQMDKLAADLKAMQADDKMRDKTIQARADECDRLMKLAESHRMFLEGVTDTITTELAKVRDAFKRKLDDNAAKASAAFDAIDASTPPAPRRKRTRKAEDAEPNLDAMSADDLFSV